MIGLPSLHTLDRAQAARIWLASEATRREHAGYGEVRRRKDLHGPAISLDGVGPQDCFCDQVVEELRVFSATLATHVPGQILEKRHLVFARLLLAFWQLPRIDGLFRVERHGDHPAAHQYDQGAIRVYALDNRDQGIVTGRDS